MGSGKVYSVLGYNLTSLLAILPISHIGYWQTAAGSIIFILASNFNEDSFSLSRLPFYSFYVLKSPNTSYYQFIIPYLLQNPLKIFLSHSTSSSWCPTSLPVIQTLLEGMTFSNQLSSSWCLTLHRNCLYQGHLWINLHWTQYFYPQFFLEVFFFGFCKASISWCSLKNWNRTGDV